MRKTTKKLTRDSSYNAIDIYRFKPKNNAQADAHRTLGENDMTVLSGPAGTGKSFLATAFALEEVISGRVDRIVITRPIVEAGESLGYLPGTFEEKVSPYMQPVMDCVRKICGRNEARKQLIEEAIEVRPLAYMRGSTFDNSVMILDEAQNCTMGQLKLFVTRIGEGSRMIINGDPHQSDLPPHLRAFSDFIDRVEGLKGVGLVEFDENSIVRHHLIGRLLRVL